MKKLGDDLKNKDKFTEKLLDKHKYVTKEFQDYGYRIAAGLGDTANASMYIKFAKIKNRAIVDSAYRFAIDYPNAKSKKRIFLWKLKQLEEERGEGNSKETKKNESKKSSNSKEEGEGLKD